MQYFILAIKIKDLKMEKLHVWLLLFWVFEFEDSCITI